MMTKNEGMTAQLSTIELNKANKVLDRFVYSCSHDLKGPLVSIRGLLRLAELSTQKKATDECLHLISESVTRMDNFLHSLESYVDNARGPLIRKEIDFKSVIKEILVDHKEYIDTNKIKINLRVSQDVGFRSDLNRVRLILSSVIENGIYFQDMSKAEHFVDVEVLVSHESTHIEICDNGEGISRDTIGKIYKMFFRASEASKGSGMGLFLAKEAVKKLEGSINAVSSRGIGTNFIISLPNYNF